MTNAGYRFRYDSGFFINTGAYFGGSNMDYDWEYRNLWYVLSDITPREGDYNTVFGMVEISVGLEF